MRIKFTIAMLALCATRLLADNDVQMLSVNFGHMDIRDAVMFYEGLTHKRVTLEPGNYSDFTLKTERGLPAPELILLIESKMNQQGLVIEKRPAGIFIRPDNSSPPAWTAQLQIANQAVNAPGAPPGIVRAPPRIEQGAPMIRPPPPGVILRPREYTTNAPFAQATAISPQSHTNHGAPPASPTYAERRAQMMRMSRIPANPGGVELRAPRTGNVSLSISNCSFTGLMQIYEEWTGQAVAVQPGPYPPVTLKTDTLTAPELALVIEGYCASNGIEVTKGRGTVFAKLDTQKTPVDPPKTTNETPRSAGIMLLPATETNSHTIGGKK